MKKVIHTPIALVMFAMLLILGPAGILCADELDSDTAAVICEECEDDLEAPEAVTCTLTVPANVQNGEVFTASISYSESVTPPVKEKFIFKWPTRCDYFKEKTVRVKKFKSGSAFSGSFESVVVPSATCIEGTFTAKVKVKGICKATAEMTVTNP